jgi:hypothetical protein
MSIIYIWLIIVILIIGLSTSAFALHELYTNLDSYIHVHLNIKK